MTGSGGGREPVSGMRRCWFDTIGREGFMPSIDSTVFFHCILGTCTAAWCHRQLCR